MKKAVLQWLKENNIKHEFVESTEWQIEDDMVKIINTNVSISLDSIADKYGSITVIKQDGTFSCHPPRYKFIELKQDLITVLSQDIGYLSSIIK